MGAKISLVLEKADFKFRKKTEKILGPFYCIESAPEILGIIKDEFAVSKYKSVSSHGVQFFHVGKRKFSGIYIGGIEISGLDNDYEKHVCLSSVEDFIASIPNPKGSVLSGPNILEDMISTYLIDVQVLDKGRLSPGSELLHVEDIEDSSVLSMGIQKAVNYLDTRKTTKNPLKEQHLTDILEYGQVVVGKSFTEDIVNKIASEIVDVTPANFYPQFGPTNYTVMGYSGTYSKMK